MDFEKLCQDMAKNPHIMTFSDIGSALVKGGTIGQKSGIAGGAVIGATLELSREASKRVVFMLRDLSSEQQKTLPHENTKLTCKHS